MYQIQKENLTALYAAIAAQNDLFLPVKTAGQTNFGLWTETADVDIDTLKTVKSAKDIFFPQSEGLYQVRKEEGKFTIQGESLRQKPFVVFGIRGCDVKGLEVLDKVFLSEPVDSFYAARREMGTLVAMACGRPETSCFCKVFGVDCAEPVGDVVVWLVGETLYWEAKTEKGEAFLDSVADVFENAEDNIADESRAKIREIMAKLPLGNLDKTTFGGGRTEELFNRPEWESLSEACIACGTCTFVCPTCQCYDIKDYDTGHGVKRFRCWDSCMYSDFTKMAHGNPRLTQKERFRQRFMHKLVYFPENNDGEFGCVGCGRCLVSCPISMNIVKVMKELTEGTEK